MKSDVHWKKWKSLPFRLQTALDLACPNEELWDVGCDHGHLGIEAIRSKKFSRIHFVDPAQHQIQHLRNFIPEAGFWPVPVEEVKQVLNGNFIFLGVGAATILRSLFFMQDQNLLQCRRLILGPQKDFHLVYEMKLVNYQYVEVCEVLERGRTRPLYVFDRVGYQSLNSQ